MRPFRQQRDDLHGLADEDLMVWVQEGDARAFEVIFDRHVQVAFSLAYRMCGRRAVAENVVQEHSCRCGDRGARYDRARGSLRGTRSGSD